MDLQAHQRCGVLAATGGTDPPRLIVQDAVGAVSIYDGHHIKLFRACLYCARDLYGATIALKGDNTFRLGLATAA
jgi:hypothetical protein